MQLVPYFQPIVDISTARVVGHEALARSISQDGTVRSAGMIFCDETLDEQKVLAFDRAVRLQALEQFSKAGQPGFLTINISPRWIDLLADDWIPTVEMLELYKIDPSKIVVEIVETDSDPDKLAAIVERYKEVGIRVAVDDFGSGYSRFDRVIRLEPDIVKLDMRLFKEAIRGGFPQHIVQSLSFLAERMGSQVVCEGVEDYNELKFALEIGSKLIQGFLFSEAKFEFTDIECFEQSISVQRKRFLLEGILKEEKVIEESRRIHQQIQEVARHVREHGRILDTSAINIDKSRAVKMFLCDHGGTQISPSYRLLNNEWVENHETMGTNWCWRPYFYQLLSSADTLQRRSVTSRAYPDLDSGLQIKTIASFVDENCVLMVDIKDEEDYSI